MANLSTINQLGAALGDTFDSRPIIHIEADGKYVFGETIIEIDDADVVLIDVDATAGTEHTFSTGETWAEIRANYSYIIVTGNLSQSGIPNVRPYGKVFYPATLDKLFAHAGFSWRLDGDLNSVVITLDALTDSSTGITTRFQNQDLPGQGRMQFTVIGVKKQKTVVRPEDTAVNDQAASGYMDVGTMRMQWGIANGAGVTFPEPFLAGSTPSVTATPFRPGDNQSVTLQSVDHLSFNTWVVRNESDVGIGAPTLHWSAIGVKP